MKNTRKLIPAFAMLLLSAVLMSTASFAWFSMNTSVTAGGMQVKATATGSLLISTGHGGTYSTSVNFSDGAKTLSPCTYTTVNETAGYYYVQNAADIDPNTGLIQEGKNYTYAAATAYAKASDTNAETGHYQDYVVYLKAEGAEVSFTNLTATVDFGTVTGGQLATTVDFFINTTAVTGDYTTGYTMSNTKSVRADATTKSVGLGALTIADGAVYAIVMRVYVDGAATASGNTSSAYVNSTAGDVSQVSISVNFAEAAASN